MFRDLLYKIYQRNNLTEEEMSAMLGEIFSGNTTDAQVGAFMGALATKGETYAELAGAARAMRKKAIRIETMARDVIDTCGTGGDTSGTFNISTVTAFVAAGAGAVVAKHGNRSISSQCGSADVLEAMGVNLDVDPEIVEEAIAEIGIGFLFAPKFHGAMKYAANARKQVGLRSIFNMLGPLTNPAAANRQLVGVFAPELTEMFAKALQRLGTKRALVVHGHDGLDEISVCAPTRVCELNQGQISTYDISPETYFGRMAAPEEIAGGDPGQNAEITKSILSGEKSARRDIVVINAAAALVAAGRAESVENGVTLAEKAIDSGAAMDKLNALIEFTTENA
ncbi:anthranilate phosphoribosyltransferase [Desulfosalsimonas propionicica]|uniref:Anthranilate phosphoribosyltransferase n=1 Tax=Desulfosalsimonas propionicica TaxID=332175 RepID=A0A7W0C828_9BACT|nr:anthranilate phosphoribosyltransferase [Desulfosalsimonas propionicica]MBA2880888.1 anthranilate phosphoribosyltransferase [Desulfosalsimonas propionicica]